MKSAIENPSHSENVRLLRIKDVMEITGMSRSSIYQYSQNGRFPKGVALAPGGNAIGWIESEVRGWIKQRIDERNAEV